MPHTTALASTPFARFEFDRFIGRSIFIVLEDPPWDLQSPVCRAMPRQSGTITWAHHTTESPYDIPSYAAATVVSLDPAALITAASEAALRPLPASPLRSAAVLPV